MTIQMDAVLATWDDGTVSAVSSSAIRTHPVVLVIRCTSTAITKAVI